MGLLKNMILIKHENFVYLIKVWRLVFIRITNPKDLKNLSNCSLFFRELLFDLRVQFLLPSVFTVIFQKTTGKLFESHEHAPKDAILDTYFMKTDTNLKETILNCRLVCSTWNAAVSNCYEQQLMTGNTTFVDDIYRKNGFFKPFPWNMQRFCFYFQPEKASEFVRMFEDSHFVMQQRNPFIGRLVHIELTLDPVDEEVDFIIAIENILRMFGGDIWYAYLFVTSKRESIGANDYLRLRQYIGFLPNLRYLYVRFNTHNARNLTLQYVNQNPLPKLVHLVVLEVGDMTGPVLNEIISKNNHVVYFGIHGQHNFQGRIDNDIGNLKGFSATCVGQADNLLVNWIGTQYEFGILQLQQRCIDFNMNLNFQFMATHLADSLKDLTLELGFPVDQQELVQNSKNLRLHLPQLQRLAIQFSGIHFLDFVCDLQNLEICEIMLVPKEYVANYDLYQTMIQSEQIIQFVSYETRMFDSNIWQILAKLRKLKIYFEDSCRCYEYTKNYTTN